MPSPLFPLRFRCLFSLLLFFLVSFGCPGATDVAVGQVSDERTILRYLSLLEKRPGPGTAFDRVYGFYESADRLDELVVKLKQPATSPAIQSSRELLLGMVLLKDGRAEEAVPVLKDALTNRPDDAIVRRQLAESYLQVNDYQQAAVLLEPLLADTNTLAAATKISEQLSLVYERLSQPTKAVGMLQELNSRFPEDVGFRKRLTNKLIQTGQTKAALQLLDAQLKDARSAPDRLTLQIQRADLLFQANQLADAIVEYQAAIDKLKPGSWQAEEIEAKLRTAFQKQGDSTAWENYLRGRVAQNPTDLGARTKLIRYLAQNRQHEMAVQVFEAAAQSASNTELSKSVVPSLAALNRHSDVDAVYESLKTRQQLTEDDLAQWAGFVLARETLAPDRRRTTAAAIFSILLRLPNDDPMWMRRVRVAEYLQDSGLLEEAEQQLKAAVESSDAEPSASITYAEFLYRRQRPEDAKRRLGEASRSANVSVSDLRRAIQLLLTNQEAETASDLVKELAAREPSSDHRLLLTRVLLIQKRFAAAQQHLSSLLNDNATGAGQRIRRQIVDLLLETDTVPTVLNSLVTLPSRTNEEALLLVELAESQGRFTLALQVLSQLSGDVRKEALQLTARIQQKAGQLLAAESTLEILVRENPRESAVYLESIQDLQLQSGREAEAYQTAGELFRNAASSPASVRRYVTFLQNSQRNDEALAVLQQYLGDNAQDVSLMMTLADELADRFQSEEAGEWLWRAFARTQQETTQREIARRLMVLALRTNTGEETLNRLKDRLTAQSAAPRHRALLMAEAYRQSRQLPKAIDELETQLQTDPLDHVILEELVDLNVELRDRRRAIEFQLRITALKPEESTFRRLVQLVEDQTPISLPADAMASFQRISDQPGWTSHALQIADHCLRNDQHQLALRILQNLKPNDSEAWKVVVRGLEASGKTAEASTWHTRAQEILTTPLAPRQLLALAIGNRNHLPPDESVLEAEARHRMFQLLPEIAQKSLTLFPQSQADNFSKTEVVLFAERGIQRMREAVVTADELKKWAVVFADVDEVSHQIAALAMFIAASSETNGNENQDSTVAENMTRLLSSLRTSHPNLIMTSVVQAVHQQLLDAGQNEIAQRLRLQSLKPNQQTTDSELKVLWQVAVDSKDRELAQAVLNEWSQLTRNRTATVSLPEHMGRQLALFASLSDVQQRAELLASFLNLKAGLGIPRRSLSPLDGQSSFRVEWLLKSSHRIFNQGRHVGSRNVVTLPADAWFSQSDVTFFVNAMLGLSPEQQSELIAAAKRAGESQQNVESRVYAALAVAHLRCLQPTLEKAILAVIEAALAKPNEGMLRVLVAAYHAKNGHAAAALNVLETIQTTDVKAWQQSRWLMLEIGTTSGQKQIAEQAAEALLGTRLTSDERRYLNRLIERQQLTVKSVLTAESKTQQQRPLEVLIEQMEAAQKQGQTEQAVQIANSLLTSGNTDRFSTRMSEAAIQSAVDILKDNKQLQIALQQTNRQLQVTPESEEFLRLKLKMLKALNLQEEASQLDSRLQRSDPRTARGWLQRAERLEDDRQFEQAADNYLIAFRKKPELLLQDYYRYFKLFGNLNRMADLADLLMTSGLKNFRDNYFVVSELIDLLLSQPDTTEAGQRQIEVGFRLLQEAWKAYPTDRAYLLNNIQARRLWQSPTVVQYACDSMTPDSRQQAFARPWLGLDASANGDQQASPIQRALQHLTDKTARRKFAVQVSEACRQYPEWQAGPLLRAALDGDQTAEGTINPTAFELKRLLTDQVEVPVVAMTNAAVLLRGRGQESDRLLADLLSRSLQNSTSLKIRPFDASPERLVADLYFKANDQSAARRAVWRALLRIEQRAKSSAGAELSFQYLLSLLEAFDIFQANGLPVEALAVAHRLTPELQLESQDFSDATNIDRRCVFTWRRAAQIRTAATADSMLQYLKRQKEDVDDGLLNDWNLLLNRPAWGQNVTWECSHILLMLRRLGRQPSLAKLGEFLNQPSSPAHALCRIAYESTRPGSSEFSEAVAELVKMFEGRSAATGSQNRILAWGVVKPLQAVQGSITSTDDSLIKVLFRIAVPEAETSQSDVWRQSIFRELAEMQKQAGDSALAARRYSDSLDALLPPLQKRPSTDRSPLQETRRLLLRP